MGSTVNWIVACAKCGLRWNRGTHVSEYERQAMESRPCPECGAYTLTCSEMRLPEPARSGRRAA